MCAWVCVCACVCRCVDRMWVCAYACVRLWVEVCGEGGHIFLKSVRCEEKRTFCGVVVVFRGEIIVDPDLAV